MAGKPIYTVTYQGAGGTNDRATIDTDNVDEAKRTLEGFGYTIVGAKLKSMV